MNFIPFAQNFPIPNYRVLPNMQPMIGFYNQEFIRGKTIIIQLFRWLLIKV